MITFNNAFLRDAIMMMIYLFIYFYYDEIARKKNRENEFNYLIIDLMIDEE